MSEIVVGSPIFCLPRWVLLFELLNLHRQQPFGQSVSAAKPPPHPLGPHRRNIDRVEPDEVNSRSPFSSIDREAAAPIVPTFATDKTSRKHGYRVDRPVREGFPEAASCLFGYQEQDQASRQGWREWPMTRSGGPAGRSSSSKLTNWDSAGGTRTLVWVSVPPRPPLMASTSVRKKTR